MKPFNRSVKNRSLLKTKVLLLQMGHCHRLCLALILTNDCKSKHCKWVQCSPLTASPIGHIVMGQLEFNKTYSIEFISSFSVKLISLSTVFLLLKNSLALCKLNLGDSTLYSLVYRNRSSGYIVLTKKMPIMWPGWLWKPEWSFCSW